MASAFPATIPVKIDADGRIAVDMECPHCGYNLRMQRVSALLGRPEDAVDAEAEAAASGGEADSGDGHVSGGPGGGGACPECGQAIDVTLREDADRLAQADPGWLGRIRRGTRWLHVGAVLSLLLVLPGLVVAAAALWLLTTREPGRDETWYARGTRLSARWASVGAAAAALATLGLLVGRYGGAWSSLVASFGEGPAGVNPVLKVQRAVAPLFDLLVSTAAASMAVALLEAWRHLFALAARADGPTVAQRCRRTWKRYLIGVGIIVALAAGTNLVERFDVRLPTGMYEWSAVILLGVVVMVLLWVWWATVGLTKELVKVLGKA